MCQSRIRLWFGPSFITATIRQQRYPKTIRFASTSPTIFGAQTHDSEDPVIIVGGGPTGLLLSLLLARYEVPSIVLEKQSVEQRFQHPQAHFLNTRTMEILKHYLPDIYQRVRSAMPCVSLWRYFRFGASLKDPDAIVVRHPVDIPLQADLDANGVLLQDFDESKHTRDLSPVTVGHLAQHTFGRILYDQASLEPNTTLIYDTEATRLSTTQNEPMIQVETRKGNTYKGRLVIGADGAHSFVRQRTGIRMHGTAEMQHLMNIHVRHEMKAPPAMLYSTYTPTSVAMTVCHSPGEYIVQIPFFKPYQTPEEDFAPEKLSDILGDIFGEPIPASSIISAKPWTMGSLVAERYVSDKIVLIGDAAHVFPPAGGFGMNTGLQDAHNLAWKIAGGHDLTSYERERRPVAQQNAALSVRNYERLLKVTQSAYLDKRHPDLLKTILDHSLLPLSARKGIFRSLYKAALFPFSWLPHPGGLYANHIRSNLRSSLQQGTGLPLLFPANEIGFSYYDTAYHEKNVRSNQSQWLRDTIPSQPLLTVGSLVPHDTATLFSRKYSFEELEISTTDLSGQLSLGEKSPYVLLCWKTESSDASYLEKLSEELNNKLCGTVRLVVASDSLKDLSPFELSQSIDRLLITNGGFFSESDPQIVLVRPDGHVQGIVAYGVEDLSSISRIVGALSGVMST